MVYLYKKGDIFNVIGKLLYIEISTWCLFWYNIKAAVKLILFII